MLPLPAATVRRLLERLSPWRYRRIYGAFAGQDILDDGPAIVARAGAHLPLRSSSARPGMTAVAAAVKAPPGARLTPVEPVA